jgi:hypothetical protein
MKLVFLLAKEVDKACNALDRSLMGRDRASQQNVHAGIKSTANTDTFVTKGDKMRSPTLK